MKKIDIEKIFLSILGSNAKLKWYLQYNINLINYIENKWPQWMAFIDLTFALIPREKRRELVGEINVERILKVLEKERPDLFKTLKTFPNGISWLIKQIKNFEERFL